MVRNRFIALLEVLILAVLLICAWFLNIWNGSSAKAATETKSSRTVRGSVQTAPSQPGLETDSIRTSEPATATLELINTIGGAIESVAVSGTVAYVGEGQALTVLDVSDPTQPAPLSRLSLGGFINDLVVANGLLYGASETEGLQIIDIGDPTRPWLLASLDLPGEPTSLFLTGDLLYLAGGEAGMWIVDISNPAQPTLLTKYSGAVYDVQVAGNLAYVVVGRNLPDAALEDFQILDVSDPLSPTVHSTIPLTQALALDVHNEFVYVSTSTTLQVIDVSDPQMPFIHSTYTPTTTWGVITDVLVDGKRAYLADWNSHIFGPPFFSCGFQVLDVEDPSTPKFLGSLSWESNDRNVCNGNVQVVGTNTFLSNGDLQVIDVGIPTQPVSIGSYQSIRPRDVLGKERLVYLADELRGLQIMDLVDARNPLTVGQWITDFMVGQDIYMDGGLLYLSTRVLSHAHFPSGGLRIIDVHDPSSPMLLGTYSVFSLDVDVSNDRAYILRNVLSLNSDLDILDVRDPTAPVPILKGYRPYTSTYGPTMSAIDVVGNRSHIASATDFQILDTRVPWDPYVLGSTDIFSGTWVMELQVVGHTAYLANYAGALILDVSDPTQPHLIATYEMPVGAGDLQWNDDKLYVAGGTEGVHILNVEDSPNPVLLESRALNNARRISVAGDTILVVGERGLLYILRYAPLVSTTVSEGSGSLSSPSDGTSYNFSPGTFSDTVRITHTTRLPGALPPLEDLSGVSHFFEIRAEDALTQQPVQPNQPYTLTVQYTEDELGSSVETTLALYYWDGNQWVQDPTSTLDAENNTITATPDRFSVWAVLGETNRLFMPTLRSNGEELGISYQAYVEGIGWMDWVDGPSIAGTTDQSLQMEAIRIRASGLPEGTRLTYQVHVQDLGWLDWVYDGEIAGALDQGKRIEAIKIKLENAPPGFRIAYVVHVQDLGWLEGVYDGDIGGTTGENRRLEAIRILIVEP